MAKELQHFGILGMKWGRRRAGSPSHQRDMKKANDILNNPKSSKKDLDWALRKSGVDPVTGKTIKQKVSYDGNGKQITGPKSWRIGKEKGMSDKRFDKMFDDEMAQLHKEVKAEKAAKIKQQAATVIRNREKTQQLVEKSLYFRQSKWVDQKLGGHPDSSPAAVIARNLIGQAVVTVAGIAIINKLYPLG